MCHNQMNVLLKVKMLAMTNCRYNWHVGKTELQKLNAMANWKQITNAGKGEDNIGHNFSTVWY